MSRGVVAVIVVFSVVTSACSTQAVGPLFCEGIPDYDIVAADLDGNTDVLVESSGADGYVDWSPDGSQIAFVSSRDGNCDIYVAIADGSNQRNLTTSEAAVGVDVGDPRTAR